jgi:hypothetical protein
LLEITLSVKTRDPLRRRFPHILLTTKVVERASRFKALHGLSDQPAGQINGEDRSDSGGDMGLGWKYRRA